MNVIILENNISYVWKYEMMLEKLDVEVLGVYKTWKSAYPIIIEKVPDFLIVDLFLDGNEKGLDFLKEIKEYSIPSIICTGYPEGEYVEDALSLGTVAFISKPLDEAAFKFQVKRILNQIDLESQNNYLIIKEQRNLVKVPVQNIYKIEIDRNYALIYLDTGKKYMVKLSLKKIIEQLDNRQFVRCHRSTLVNLKFIKSIDLLNNKLKLENEGEVDLGRKYKSSVKESFAIQS